ncbi:MAG: phosphate signaling complex protein PhoU [Planctomycetota bacterium]
MSKSLDDDLQLLGQSILRMGGLVEEATRRATAALTRREGDLAQGVIDADDAIDRIELEVDEECLRVLALHQPVAGDLRYITAAMKISNDLERIGDLATNVAERALDLASLPPLTVQLRFDEMTEIVRGMLHDSLDALVTRNAELARDVCLRDQRVNEINREHFGTLRECMKSDPSAVDSAVELLSASRQLERMGDQTTNIAEDVVFLVEGLIVKHGAAQPHAEDSGAG